MFLKDQEERAFAKPKKHKIIALITLFLDSSQTVTQLTTQQAVGVEAVCRCHRRQIPFLFLNSVLLSSKDGPRCGRTVTLHGCFRQARAPQQLPGEQDKQQDPSKNPGGMWPLLREPAWAGLQKEPGLNSPWQEELPGWLEARRPLTASSPALTHQGRYVPAPRASILFPEKPV